jgi:hypothetical protein
MPLPLVGEIDPAFPAAGGIVVGGVVVGGATE